MGKSPFSSFAAVNGVRLHYLEWGNATRPAVVLLHGLSSTCHNWDFVCRALADDYHLFALDQRGHGDSGRPASGYHTRDYAADVAAFRRALGLQRVLLIGHSMGGRVGLIHASTESELEVKGLVLVDVGPEAPRAGLERVLAAIHDAPESFADDQEAYEHIRRLRPRYSHDTLQHRVRHSLRKREDGRLTWKYDRSALLQTIHARPGVDWWDCLAKLTCPTLVVRGAASDILAAETTRKMMEVIKSGRLVEIPEGTHTVPFEDTDLFEKAVLSFLAELQ